MTRDRQVRDATDLYALVSQYVQLRRRGSVAVGKCPWHDDKRPSFTVNLPGHKHAGKWACYPCGLVGGDAQDFLSRIEGITSWEALKRLAAEAGIPMDAPAESPEVRRAKREEKRTAARWYRGEWVRLRQHLERAMARAEIISYRESVPRSDPGWAPVIGWNLAGQMAETFSGKLRWIERERGTEAGMEVWRRTVGRG